MIFHCNQMNSHGTEINEDTKLKYTVVCMWSGEFVILITGFRSSMI